ncbi:MAG TPA: hypothetical protein VNY73_07560 [Bacteroidia bacterium]|jgi:hypothetical protein|nr:hypothetical protein [Bacteroidia bacterium]
MDLVFIVACAIPFLIACILLVILAMEKSAEARKKKLTSPPEKSEEAISREGRKMKLKIPGYYEDITHHRDERERVKDFITHYEGGIGL